MAKERERRFTADDLTTAAANGNLAEVQQILQFGVDVNARNSFGRTAIQVMTHCYVKLAEELLRAGADPNVQDLSPCSVPATSTYRTICHDVAASGSLTTLKCLLRHGADINLVDSKGNTPAHVGAKSGHFTLVQYLLSGTNYTLCNSDKRTPLDYLDDLTDPGCRQWVERRRSNPLTLRSLCVIAVRSALGPEGLRDIRSSLQLPVPLVNSILLQNHDVLDSEVNC